jgi:excisionase family DNA binding protein
MATDLDARVFTVSEAARLLRISDRLYYGGVARGELPAVRIGRRLVVPGAQLRRLLEGGDRDDRSE